MFPRSHVGHCRETAEANVAFEFVGAPIEGFEVACGVVADELAVHQVVCYVKRSRAEAKRKNSNH